MITKYDDVVAVGRDGATYSSDQKRGGVVRARRAARGRPNFEQGGNLMLTMDAPEHTRYRKLVNRGFTPRQMRMLEPHIRELTNKILDEVIEAGRAATSSSTSRPRCRCRSSPRCSVCRRRTGTSSSSGATG